MEITKYIETAEELYAYIKVQGKYSCPCSAVPLEEIAKFKNICDTNGINILIEECNNLYEFKRINS